MLHTLYIATCYIPYTLLLLIGLIILPALALFPGLIRTPLLASTIPIISILLVNIITLILFALHFYTHIFVVSIILLISITGFYRVKNYYSRQVLAWPENSIYIILINVAILLPMLAFNGISTFIGDDALASWNYWAVNIYTGVLPDTMGYPPFYPIFLSLCYKLLGNLEYQGPIKALLCIFPFTIMCNIAFISKRTAQTLPVYLLTLFSSVFPGFLTIGFYQFYTTGYADPVLAATMAASFVLFSKYLDEPKPEYLWYAVLCGITAALTKQPALLWALFSMPAVILWRSYQQRQLTNYHILMLVVLIMPVFAWLAGAGRHFYDNTGVITASLHSSQINIYTMYRTLVNAIYQYLVLQPSILLIYLLAGIAAYKQKKMDLYITFIIPATLLWFIFGSYHIRLGLHIIVCCALLIASQDYFVEVIQKLNPGYEVVNHYIWQHLKKVTYIFFILCFALFVIFSIRIQINKHQNMPGKIYPLNAGLTNIEKYFGADANEVYKNIYNNPAIKIWVPTRYISGIFYGHTPMVPVGNDMSTAGIYKTILQYKPNYLFSPGRLSPEISNIIQRLVQQCPQLFSEIQLGKPLYDYRVYKFNVDVLNSPRGIICSLK
jgi:hypothetical protein